MIANKSYPLNRSFNDLVPRKDCKTFLPEYEYFTFAKFLEILGSLGKNTLLSQFDIKDAYKNCKIRTDELWQQVYKVDKKYFIDLGGMFGSRNAGDAWNVVMELIIKSAQTKTETTHLYYFVDNGINLTPPLQGEPNMVEAKKKYDKIIKFLDMAGVPYHECQHPTTKAKFLGWLVDTVEMTVSITPERWQWMKTVMMTNKGKISKKFTTTITGILDFLSNVLPFLRAPLGWIRRRSNQQEAGRETCNENFKRRFICYWAYVNKIVNKWQGKARIQEIARAETDPDIHLFCDASGEIGYGAINLRRKSFIQGRWNINDLSKAKREKSISSTRLGLLCICRGILSLQKGESAQIHCDSQSAVATFTKI